MPEPSEPPSQATPQPVPQRSIWFFASATVIFAAPAIFLPEMEVWLRVATVVAGFALIIIGGVFLTREMQNIRDRRAAGRQRND